MFEVGDVDEHVCDVVANQRGIDAYTEMIGREVYGVSLSFRNCDRPPIVIVPLPPVA